MEDVLVVGSGGREHALAWKISQSPAVGKVITAPGNGGTRLNADVRADDVGALADLAAARSCFTVVGPEAPLAAGIADEFARRGLGIFAPTRAAARLETSKSWSKDFMSRHGIPTARYGTFDDPREASEFAGTLGGRVAVKADGLAAGKGVIMCADAAEARSALESMMLRGSLGDAGRRVVVEEALEGAEASFIAMCDGTTAVPMASSQDHKRAFDGDEGPNTGGMGAYSPAAFVGAELEAEIMDTVVRRAVDGMRAEGAPFTGFLYAGVMIGGDGRPRVLEFNARMGDPECQPIVMRARFDMYEYMRAAAQSRLASMPEPAWDPRPAACVVLASRGYPGGYATGEQITGVPAGSAELMAFHAGTRTERGALLSAGGRVMGVTAVGGGLREAVARAYEAADGISWRSKFCRRDIASGALAPRGPR